MSCLCFYSRILFLQDETINKMENLIETFHEKIVEVQKQRLPIHVGGNFVDIFIVTLIQELNILKQYEDGEDNLNKKVNENETLVHEMQVSN